MKVGNELGVLTGFDRWTSQTGAITTDAKHFGDTIVPQAYEYRTNEFAQVLGITAAFMPLQSLSCSFTLR
jgi:hypothetical protein